MKPESANANFVVYIQLASFFSIRNVIPNSESCEKNIALRLNAYPTSVRIFHKKPARKMNSA